MLAIADRYGIVSASIPGLAHVAHISEEGCRRAITKLESPDPDSRTPDFEGRRIEPIEGGWRVLNYEKYRNMLSLEERKEYNRIKQQESRSRRQTLSKNVKDGQGRSALSIQAEAKAEAESRSKEEKDIGKLNLPNGIIDSEWISRLAQNKAYEGIDIKCEHGRMIAWCEVNHKTPTRRRFVNWLNRADQPLDKKMVSRPMTKFGYPLPDRCSIARNGDVLDNSGRVMDVNQVRKAQ